MRTVVTFKSAAFNTTESKDYFINPCCFGDDVAKWLMAELKQRGFQTVGEAGQEDFGWYFTFQAGGIEHDFIIGFRPDEEESAEGDWIGWLERRTGLISSLFGGRKRGIQPAAAQAIHAVLTGSPQIQDVRWHERQDFDSGREELGSPQP